MNGHKDYEFLDIEQRKAMLAYFSSFVRRLPISYTTFVYRRSQFEDPARLMERMGRDISSAMVEHLDFFQSFDDVKVYYDNGQDIVKQALDRSVGKVLSKGVVRGRKTSMTDYRLEQVADYLCTIELALVKCEAKENGETYNKFFGGIGSFKRNWLKQSPQQADIAGLAVSQGTVSSPLARNPGRRASSSGSRNASNNIASTGHHHRSAYSSGHGFD